MLSYINNPFMFLIMFGAFLVAITVHEWAHAYMADRLGDPTARLAELAGRIIADGGSDFQMASGEVDIHDLLLV